MCVTVKKQFQSYFKATRLWSLSQAMVMKMGFSILLRKLFDRQNMRSQRK